MIEDLSPKEGAEIDVAAREEAVATQLFQGQLDRLMRIKVPELPLEERRRAIMSVLKDDNLDVRCLWREAANPLYGQVIVTDLGSGQPGQVFDVGHDRVMLNGRRLSPDESREYAAKLSQILPNAEN